MDWGIGLLRGKVQRWLPTVSLLALFGAVKLFNVLTIRSMDDKSEYIWAIVPKTGHEVGIVPAVLVLFALTAVLFIPLGAGLAARVRGAVVRRGGGGGGAGARGGHRGGRRALG